MKLKEIREKKGIKQKVIAEVLGIARQTYASHEAKPWLMTMGEAQTVCDFLGVSTEEVEDFSLPRKVI